jgi:hypothetical protein
MRVEFCTKGFRDGTRGREVEESPLLEAAARERLIKTQEAEKSINGYCGDL